MKEARCKIFGTVRTVRPRPGSGPYRTAYLLSETTFLVLLFLALFVLLLGKVIFDSSASAENSSVRSKVGQTISRNVAFRPAPTAKDVSQKTAEPGYESHVVSSAGLTTTLIATPFGRIFINLPDELYPGDTFSGTVGIEPAGKTADDRANNQTELNGMVVEVGQQPSRVGEKIFKRTISTNLGGKPETIVLLYGGKAVVTTSIPITNNPPPTPSSNTQLPTCGQIGRNVVIADHCDGIIAADDSCTIGGVALEPLAESPRMRVLQNNNQTPGPTQIKYREQGREVSGPFQNLGVALTSPNTSLLRNQQTTMEVAAMAPGVQEDISLDVTNNTPSIISISGGNNQHFIIHPADLQQDGSFRKTFTVTADHAGGWGATATVACVAHAAAKPGTLVILPTPTPTPSPHPMPIPAATPSPSASPCAPTPTPTTYAVKDLGLLPTSDGSTPHCMATGVNEAGNVVGACLGKYKGGPPSGSWRAFKTDAGGAAIKAKDDLGFPTGAIGGVSFGMAVNKDGHVVGYWADAPTGGTDHKGFWYDGSKMLNLHPPTFPLKVSEAYALNDSDDVVGTAWTLFSDKHAVIWPSGAHTMIDLNDYMDSASKKDWKLLEAYDINDVGEIVGRAVHLKKLHAFLLKGKGLVPIDLGAIAEFADDSSVAYSLNSCDQIVGYTYTPALHHGFVWKPEIGMKDMGTISPPYTYSYAQSINKKGEIVGTVSKTFHHSAFFEGIGFAIGSDPAGVAYSHAVWYNGFDLIDLNGEIPGFKGWELNLANGINDKGQIAGSGFFKGPGYTKGSLITKAVLLTPKGLVLSSPPPASSSSCPLAIKGGYIFDNWNICGVKNSPTSDTTFSIASPAFITFIATYHWNYGMGALPGTKGISLKDGSGKVFGPWSVTTSAGSGGKANVNWECHPGVTLPAGTYTVIDPDPATWSQNDGSTNKGFARVAGSTK